MLENFAKEKEALEANLRQGFEKEKRNKPLWRPRKLNSTESSMQR